MQLNLFLLPVTIVLSLVIFVIDISLPLGVAGGVPYILVLFLALRVQGLRVTLVFGTICTLLVLLGWFFSPEGITSWIVTTNRLLAVFAIWSVVAVGLWAKRSQLMESELERIIENSPVSMVVVDSSQNILQVNSETESKFGYRREELKGEPVIILIPERFRERHEAAQEGYMKSPDIRAMGGERELFALRKDGDEFPIEIGLNPIFQDGEVVIVASIIDISERLKAMAHQKNLASILHSMGDAVISEDLNGKITAWNRAATEMFGYSEGEAIAKPTSLTLPVDRREEPFSNLEKILEGEQVLDAEILMAR
ncbi:PAS domain S-box protein, partial [bacterium]|nr:PAS domain S-box protein [bacterium]